MADGPASVGGRFAGLVGAYACAPAVRSSAQGACARSAPWPPGGGRCGAVGPAFKTYRNSSPLGSIGPWTGWIICGGQVLLREFLYVDGVKVRGMLGQIDEGVAEESRKTVKDERTTQGGVRGFASHQQRWGSEDYVTKSLGDALFPTLEDMLTANGNLLDISEELREPEYWTEGLRQGIPPGSLVRITADGALFDARYVSTILSGFVAVYSGLTSLGVDVNPSAPSSSTKRGPNKAQRRPGTVAADTDELEDKIREFAPMLDDQGEPVVTPEYIRGIIKLSRGMFTPGLHLNLLPTAVDTNSVSVRLQEGREFLDSDPEILFARYGLSPQEWTVVGTIGHYSEQGEPVMNAGELAGPTGNMIRARAASFINSFVGLMASLGFADAPQYPGFSIVPLAVYRAIPQSVSLLPVPMNGGE